MTQALTFSHPRTYLYAALFIAGNIALPQLCHLLPQGGLVLLPIYFFTLIAAYRFGWQVGLCTALCSPLLNHLLFGMPPAAALPVILVKSTLLAFAASFVANQRRDVSLLSVAAAVAAYQVGGSLFEWAFSGSLSTAASDVRLGFPGLLLQIFGGWALLKLLWKSSKTVGR